MSPKEKKILLHAEKKEEILILKLSGSIDIFNLENIKKNIEDIIMGHSRLILDLSKVEYIDSSGIGLIVGTLKRLKKNNESANMVIFGLNEYLEGLFKLINFSKLIPIAKNLDEALDIVKK